MKNDLMYIENKSSGHSGEAWIGAVELSKSGQTVYFNNQAFKKLKTTGISGNHFDIETGEEYWISGVKRDGQDRHKFGGGKVMIDEKAVEKYLDFIKAEKLENNKFEIVQIQETDKSRFSLLENSLSEHKEETYQTRYWDRNRKKLID